MGNSGQAGVGDIVQQLLVVVGVGGGTAGNAADFYAGLVSVNIAQIAAVCASSGLLPEVFASLSRCHELVLLYLSLLFLW